MADISKFTFENFEESKENWESYESRFINSLEVNGLKHLDDNSKVQLFLEKCGPEVKNILRLKFDLSKLESVNFLDIFKELRLHYQLKKPLIIKRADESNTLTDPSTMPGREKETDKQLAKNNEIDVLNSWEDLYKNVLTVEWEKLGPLVSEVMRIVSRNINIISSGSLKIYGTANDNLFNLVRKGTKIIDAMYCLSVEDRSKLTFRATDEVLSDLKIVTTLRKLYYLVIYVIVRGKPPIGDWSVPEILKGYNVDLKTLYSDLTNISSGKINWDWLRCVDLTFLPIDMKKKLKLAVAGHRFINFLKLGTPMLNKEFIANFNAAFNVPSWDVFPLTRSSAVNQQFPLMTKCLLDLIARSYSEEYLERCVKNNLLSFNPIPVPKFSSWSKWNPKKFKIKYPIIFDKTEHSE